MDLLNEIVKEIGSDYAKIASDKEDKEQFIDTGSYIFNGLVSGSILGGVSSNRITAIAGETSTGKTFFSLAVVKNFLDNNPNGYVLYFDTESAVNRDLLETRGIDTRRVGHIEVVTVEEFRNKALKALDIYLDKPIEERTPCLFVLDSLGMLSTEKEIRDALEDKNVRDMTKSQLVKCPTHCHKSYIRCHRSLCTNERNGGRFWTQVCSEYNHLSQQEQRERWNGSRWKHYQGKDCQIEVE